MNADEENVQLKKRIAELELQLRSSIGAHADSAKEWAGRVAMQGAALHKASSIFETIARNMALPDDMRVLAMTGFHLCDKALLEAGWAQPERPSPPDQKPRPE